MNAIEQMMQAFGASSAQSVAAMFGTSAAAESNAVEFANQFAAALQNNETAVFGANSPWRLTQNPMLEAYNTTGVEALPGVDGVSADFIGQIAKGLVAPATSATASGFQGFIDQHAQDAGDLAALLADGDPQAFTDGIPGLQLIKLTGVELSSLINEGQLQPLDGTIVDGAPAANDIFLFAANTGQLSDAQPVRLLPLAQLEAITLPQEGQAAAITQAGAGIDAAAQAAALANSGASQTPIVQEQAQATAPTAANSATAAEAAKAAGADPVAANTSTTPAATAQSETFTAAATKAAADTLQNSQNAVQQAKADAAAEGHAAQQNQKAAEQQAKSKNAQAQAQASASQSQAGAAQGKAGDAQATQAAAQTAAASTPAAKPAGPRSSAPSTSEESPRNAEGVAAQRQATQQTAPARTPAPVTWTPERIAGVPESASLTEAVAGGIGGLKGEPSFMNSMGLMGGRPSATLGGHIAKQVNFQVTRAVKDGTNEFTMRLNPTELGNIRIKMAFNEAGRVSAQVFVERPETLEMMQRELRGFEKAVEAGGHKLEQGGLSFNLDTGDGQSAGKSFAEAVQQDRMKEQMEGGSKDGEALANSDGTQNDLTDLAALEQILSRVSPDTGLDVRV